MFKNDSDENDDANFDKGFRRIHPDFYKAGKIILDAKYKRLEQCVGREDVYQGVSYMRAMSKKDGNVLSGGFIIHHALRAFTIEAICSKPPVA